MKLPYRFAPAGLAALFAFAVAGCATAPATPAATSSRVQVDWSDPANFADTRTNQCRTRVKPEEWLGRLAKYVERRAGDRLAEGQTLKVTITDIQRAGQCEPWRGPYLDDARIVKDIYPPRIDLHFTLVDAQGHVVSEGDRKLTDMAFLHRGGLLDDNDPLRYEKRLLDDWLRKEFGKR